MGDIIFREWWAGYDFWGYYRYVDFRGSLNCEGYLKEISGLAFFYVENPYTYLLRLSSLNRKFPKFPCIVVFGLFEDFKFYFQLERIKMISKIKMSNKYTSFAEGISE